MAINWIGNDTAQTVAVRGSELQGGVADGGGGIDTLELRDLFYPQTFDFTALTTFQNVEIIRGVIEVAKIRIRADQLAGVTTIDSADVNHRDEVTIVGSSVDLRGKTFIGNLVILPETANAVIQVSDFATASLIKPAVRGIHVQIQTGNLTPAQRDALYDQGIDKITVADGIPMQASAPVLSQFQDDAVSYQVGTEVFIDAGANATLAASGHLSSLVVKLTGSTQFFDTLDLEVGQHVNVLSPNAEGNNVIVVDGVEVGTVYRLFRDGSLNFTFNQNATTDRIQEVIRSISYEYRGFGTRSGSSLGIEMTLTDAGGRMSKAASVIKIGSDPIPEPGPILGTDANDVLSGSSGNDVIKGLLGNDTLKSSAGNDDLDGGAGNDRLWGGTGNDTLKGDVGRDIFVFDTKPHKSTNKDKITDFSVKDDGIWLENKVFTKLGKSGSEKKPAQLKKDFFTLGSKAKDKNDYVVYDKAKGALYYDADGSGKGKAVEIATLSKKLAMTYKDFCVI